MNKSMLIQHLKSNPGGAIAASIALLFSIGVTTASAQSQTLLTRHTRDAVSQGRAAFVQHLDSGQTLHLVIGLPLRNQENLNSFLQGLYDPNSPNYRQYLSVEQFTQMFGPTGADYDAVIKFAQSNGFVVSGTAPNRLIVEVDASVANIESAFNVPIKV
jgi:subtilase family serine protease